MKTHKGSSLRARAGSPVNRKQMEAVLKSARATAAQARPDGPRKGEQHPPRIEAAARTVPPKSSKQRYETEGAKPTATKGKGPKPKGPLPGTPAPTKSWQATLTGKAAFLPMHKLRSPTHM